MFQRDSNQRRRVYWFSLNQGREGIPISDKLKNKEISILSNTGQRAEMPKLTSMGDPYARE
jgi:hypothetical protein